MLTSEEQAQKFYTYDSVCHSPYMGNASDWLKQISPSAQPIRSITQNWVVTSHQHGNSTVILQTWPPLQASALLLVIATLSFVL